jgi:LacI family transcriptional regulator
VARRAGVSKSTVSNALNRPEIVNERTRERIDRAIQELGFVPNTHARLLGGGPSQMLGLVVLDITSPFFMEAARAVERVASDANQVVILCNSESSPEKEQRLLRMLAAQDVRGILLTPATSEAVEARAGDGAPMPTVFLDFQGTADDCSVAVDDVAGARLATTHLLELGHRRFAFVGGPRDLRQFAQRALGMRETLREAGLDPALALREVTMPGFGIVDGVAAADELLTGQRPTAVFCGNDMMAFGVFRALTAAGIRVPDDVALVGYDDNDFAADWIVPLTSVRQPTNELGERAARLLLEHSAGDPRHAHQQIVLDPELIVRASSDPRQR